MERPLVVRTHETMAAIKILRLRIKGTREGLVYVRRPFCRRQAGVFTKGISKNDFFCGNCCKSMNIATLAMELKGLDRKGARALLAPAITKKAE